MYILELAKPEEAEICNDILDKGRKFQREQGFVQWPDDYPSIDTIREDIEKKRGFVLREGEKTAGYVCVDFEGEPAYEEIEGSWRTDGTYAAVHRMAFEEEFRGKGLTETVFHEIEKLCRENGILTVRMDTGLENKRMQHVLEKNGFIKCGIVRYEGNKRLAYDKLLG